MFGPTRAYTRNRITNHAYVAKFLLTNARTVFFRTASRRTQSLEFREIVRRCRRTALLFRGAAFRFIGGSLRIRNHFPTRFQADIVGVFLLDVNGIAFVIFVASAQFENRLDFQNFFLAAGIVIATSDVENGDSHENRKRE